MAVLKNTRKTIFKNALHIRSGFHLVRMGWAIHVIKNCFPDKFGALYDNVCNHLKRWIYCCMKSSCETREEFIASKLMFKKFLNSKQTKSTLGSCFINSVQNFITKHIKQHKSNFCFYLRLNIRHFDEYTNSIHKGTNCGLKYSTARVGPSTNIEKAMAILYNNTERNGKRKSRIASINLIGTKVYSKLQCANKLVPIGEYILSQNWINRFS